MTAVVALLRGVNVGGHRKVPMARLRAVAEGLGHEQVATHLNSGNVVLVAPDDAPPERLAADLAGALRDDVGFDVDVVVRTRAAFDEVVAANPFPEAAAEDPARVLVTFFAADLDPDPAFDAGAYGDEQVVWTRREAYVHYVHGLGRSRLTPDVLTRAARQAGTGRNWRTVLALRDLLAARAD
ncbi:DUF1697 domain-containing protein [Cellulomonas cellasea]|uniref:Uncharacterized protein (DUF1697 family) n=1 Tax=Cellulomonas cellasea TaxID=43670 RepID=A0A7W4UEU1_9CELL|nr:DUF1697 domain-containing protein [Cellulomonas cellasea]MBB2922836.1 uncharacterized protein (DUF1697 family) [Cellulomonas cellasea]